MNFHLIYGIGIPIGLLVSYVGSALLVRKGMTRWDAEDMMIVLVFLSFTWPLVPFFLVILGIVWLLNWTWRKMAGIE